MKRLLLISLAITALLAPGSTAATTKTYTVLLAGGEEANTIKIWLSQDGREYVIDSVVQLEVGGNVCGHPAEATQTSWSAPRPRSPASRSTPAAATTPSAWPKT